MGLINNGFRHGGGKFFGASAIDGGNPSVMVYRGHRAAANRNQFAGQGITSQVASVPDGCRAPVAWIMPRKAGGMSSRGGIGGSGGINPVLILALEGEAVLDGQGDITAFGGLIVNMLATITGSGTISAANVQAFLNLVATITGSGGVASASALRGLGALIAQIAGQGTVVSTATGQGNMGATIRGYGDLTPEGLRDSVWSALAAQYNVAGTMGNKLNSAASGGVDYGSMADAVRVELQAELLRIIELATIHGLVVGQDLVVTPSSRIAGAIDQTVVQVGDTVTVARQ